ncbi:hypothetical protein HF519_12910 [Pseudonocardia bannensis]|uniref:Uncharacterized protein n=1 Tax=Pseudonocardia bannensis TaxID=630973 RepID=A0A848DJ26_9PSEU|nr:hypothetical protein [Pseudonocardia bannensis]NMH92454.1 hypothetical protein [Pseudonocardia bannensis]
MDDLARIVSGSRKVRGDFPSCLKGRQPGPAVTGFGVADLRGAPAESLFEQPKSVLEVEPAQEPAPAAVDVVRGGSVRDHHSHNGFGSRRPGSRATCSRISVPSRIGRSPSWSAQRLGPGDRAEDPADVGLGGEPGPDLAPGPAPGPVGLVEAFGYPQRRQAWTAPDFTAAAVFGDVTVGTTGDGVARTRLRALGTSDGAERWSAEDGGRVQRAGPRLVAVSGTVYASGRPFFRFLDAGDGLRSASSGPGWKGKTKLGRVRWGVERTISWLLPASTVPFVTRRQRGKAE